MVCFLLHDMVSNTIAAMIEATRHSATTAELMGTVRQAYGYSYDPMNIIESPFN